jgi:hypothetical protein
MTAANSTCCLTSEPAWRAQLAHAAAHIGLIGALRRITGSRSAGVDHAAAPNAGRDGINP